MLFEMTVSAIFHFLYPRSHYLPLIVSLRLIHERDLSYYGEKMHTRTPPNIERGGVIK
jgi:hypothetical protein